MKGGKSGGGAAKAASSRAVALYGRAVPARDVPVGTLWAFLDHRTMAQILDTEQGGRAAGESQVRQ